MENKIYLYPVWLRLWHWFNAMLFLILLITGLCMQYSSTDQPFIRFDLAVSIHNISGILLILSYLAFLIGNIITRNGRYYKMNIKGMYSLLSNQFRYYIRGIFKEEKPPYPVDEERKFNPLQQFIYIIVMYIGLPVTAITGTGLLFPQIVLTQFLGISGLFYTSMLHVIVGFLLSIFMCIHIYFCTIGTTWTSNFKGMINGWHEPH
jgi:thiosulfate reductase cytochrome b subunit